MTSVYNFSIEQGGEYRAVITVKNNGTNLNLTGYTLSGKIRRNFQGVEIAEFSFQLKNQITDTGKIDWWLDDSALVLLEIKSPLICVYDILLTNSSGESTKIMKGTVTINPGVTL